MNHYQWDENKVLASDIYVDVSNGPISVIIDRDGFGRCYSTLLYFILISHNQHNSELGKMLENNSKGPNLPRPQ